jgi:hypothetical protein
LKIGLRDEIKPHCNARIGPNETAWHVKLTGHQGNEADESKKFALVTARSQSKEGEIAGLQTPKGI